MSKNGFSLQGIDGFSLKELVSDTQLKLFFMNKLSKLPQEWGSSSIMSQEDYLTINHMHRKHLVLPSTLICFEQMEYECPHYVQIQTSKSPAESDLTRRSLATTERPESHTENPNIQMRSGMTVNIPFS